MSKIRIVTPSLRVENLKFIKPTIPSHCEWHVFLDYHASPENVPRHIPAKHVFASGFWGHPVRNIAIQWLLNNADLDDYVYFLDDDNVIHPDWYEAIKDATGDLVCWGQLNYDDTRRNDPQVPKILKIDMASYMFRLGAIGDLRFGSDYCADGAFAVQLAEKVDRIEVISKYLCYYNYLRDSRVEI